MLQLIGYFLVLFLSVTLRLGLAFYLGNDTSNWLGGTDVQVSMIA